MKNIVKTRLAFWIIFGQIVFAQTFPDYPERQPAELSSSRDLQMQQWEMIGSGVDPDEYIVGPGDKLFISIIGIHEILHDVILNQESDIYISKVGGISLKNFTLTDVKDKIKEAINKYYKDVEVFISLRDVRKIKVTLLGEVTNPGPVTINGNARLLQLLAIPGTMKNTSNYRNIRVANNEGEEKIFDLLPFLRLGKRENNPLLHEDDIIFVDKVDKTISIDGMIKYPGTYEFKENERVIDFITLTGGFLSRAKTDTIEIVSFNENGEKQSSRFYTLDDLSNNKIILNKFDNILVREIPDYFIEKFVRVEGYVNYPGYYKIIEGVTTLSEVILSAGGFRKNASLIEASLYRTSGITTFDPEFERLKLIPRADMTDDEYDYLKAKSRQREGRVVVDFVNIFQKNLKNEDVILMRGDIITVPEAKNYITMLGQIVSPGKIPYSEGLTVEDYIKLAGGYSWRALSGDVRVIKAKTGEWIDADDVELLEPGDTIWIPENPPPPKFWDVFTTSLQIVGQVAAIVAATIAVIVASR